MSSRPAKLHFVDLETTGATPANDRITEIGVVTVEDGRVERWSTLVNPGKSIPPFIQNLTGISNAMVADAPAFGDFAAELAGRLSGGLFVAHNARFDYGFLKSAFKDAGIAWRSDLLCTVKLSRQLFPKEGKHNLDALVARHGLVAEARHRALADADLLWQFWQRLEQEVDGDVLQQAITRQSQRPTLPPQMDADILDEIPNRCGVYEFYGENDALLYVGKSVHMRSRVLAHFAAGDSDPKEMRIAQQVRRIAWHETAGEVGALLREARLVKQHQPLHNRKLRRQRELCSWQLRETPGGWLQPALVFAADTDFANAKRLYGLYATRRKAEEALRTLAEKNDLCLVMLGLESRGAGKPCFALQLQRCHGACAGHESPIAHQARLEAALAAERVTAWPFDGPVGIHERGRDDRHDVHVVHNWNWLGSAANESALHDLLAHAPAAPAFDLDTYKILLRHVTRGLLEVTPLA